MSAFFQTLGGHKDVLKQPIDQKWILQRCQRHRSRSQRCQRSNPNTVARCTCPESLFLPVFRAGGAAEERPDEIPLQAGSLSLSLHQEPCSKRSSKSRTNPARQPKTLPHIKSSSTKHSPQKTMRDEMHATTNHSTCCPIENS